MFEGVAAGRDIRVLCDELNQMGFKTRVRKLWNADHTVVIGTQGGRALIPDQARRIVERPLYAGFNFEKWTYWKPVEAHHPEIVSLKTWNAANKGKWKLERTDGQPSGWERIDLSHRCRRAYQRERPDFPFKALVHCPECGKPMKGSYSTGKQGGKFGYYHCARGHRHVGMRRELLHEKLEALLADLKFAPDIAIRFEEHIRAVWVEKVGGLNKHLAAANHEIGSLRDKADQIFEKIKLANSAMIIARLEAEYEALEQRIKLLESKRDQKEFDERDVSRVIKWARHLVEHLDELILDTQDDGLRRVFWSLVFCADPTLKDFQNGTPPVSPLVRLKGVLSDQNSSLVAPTGSGWKHLEEELIRWAKGLLSVELLIADRLGVPPDVDNDLLPLAA